MTLDLILFHGCKRIPFLFNPSRCGGCRPAPGVIKRLRAEQPLLGGWQWFNEPRAVPAHTASCRHTAGAPGTSRTLLSPKHPPPQPAQEDGAFGIAHSVNRRGETDGHDTDNKHISWGKSSPIKKLSKLLLRRRKSVV